MLQNVSNYIKFYFSNKNNILKMGNLLKFKNTYYYGKFIR